MAKEVADIIEWGQGYDDTVIELIKYFREFCNGYYGLINYGQWWECFNQGCEFDELMEKEWEQIDGDNNDAILSIEKMSCLIIGYYSKFDEFADGVIEAYENGHGLRHREDKKAVQNDKQQRQTL